MEPKIPRRPRWKRQFTPSEAPFARREESFRAIRQIVRQSEIFQRYYVSSNKDFVQNGMRDLRLHNHQNASFTSFIRPGTAIHSRCRIGLILGHSRARLCVHWKTTWRMARVSIAAYCSRPEKGSQLHMADRRDENYYCAQKLRKQIIVWYVQVKSVVSCRPVIVLRLRCVQEIRLKATKRR